MCAQIAFHVEPEAGVKVIVITGANGNLGRRLLIELSARGEVARAVVRSPRAAAQIDALKLDPAPEVVQLDYLDADAMASALRGCQSLVHLVGIIKETANGSYHDAHEGTTRVVADAAELAGIERIVYLSIVGTSVDSSNPCLSSKARGEEILLSAPVPALVIRVPMVLGEGDYASGALKARAWRTTNLLLRGSSLEQPIYGGDVVAAVLAGLDSERPFNEALDLAGPRTLSRSELTHAAAHAVGRTTRVISLPIVFGLAAAWLLQTLSANPPVTTAMLGVLDHDDQVDPAAALARLGIELTSLETMLSRCIAERPVS
jgi:NADH dehydrogenase